jgi:hypothetical protein
MSDVVEGFIVTYETVYGSAGAHSRTTEEGAWELVAAYAEASNASNWRVFHYPNMTEVTRPTPQYLAVYNDGEAFTCTISVIKTWVGDPPEVFVRRGDRFEKLTKAEIEELSQ